MTNSVKPARFQTLGHQPFAFRVSKDVKLRFSRTPVELTDPIHIEQARRYVGHGLPLEELKD